MLNKYISIISIIILISPFTHGNSSKSNIATTQKSTPITKKQASSTTEQKTFEEFDSKSATPPKIKPGEYSIFLDETYKIFKTKTFNKLELSENCFKKNKPDCLAIQTSEITPKTSALQNSGETNPAAANCTNLGGRFYIAIDSKNDQSGFCRFSDKSMVSAWSLYTKHTPPPSTK